MNDAGFIVDIGAGIVLLGAGLGMVAAARRKRRRGGGDERFGERDATALTIIGGFFAVLALLVLAASAFVEEEPDAAAPPARENVAAAATGKEPGEETPIAVVALMRETVAPWLKEHLQRPIDGFITSLPSWSGTAAAVALFVMGGLWVFFLKRSYVYLGAPDAARWRDLRFWALLSLVPYIVLYLVFL